MKRAIGIMVTIGLMAAMLTPLANASWNPPGTEADPAPIFNEVYTFPRYPIGATWNNVTQGDVIILYVNVTGNYLPDGVWIQLGFCNRNACLDSPLSLMEHVSGTLYKFELPGDYTPDHIWPYYEASSNPASDIYFWLYADTPNLDNYAFYPGPDDTVDAHIYPAFPPSQLNATSALSKSTMFTGETFWVNGTSNYWNSTSYPNDFSKLLPADECPVTVKVGSDTFNTKTNIWGNYSVQVTAPATAGSYSVNVTVSNATANRNVTCVSTDKPITVNAHSLAMTINLEPTATLVNETLWANGTVALDSAAPGQVLQVNFSLAGTNITWFANTSTDGAYTSQFTAPAIVGNYTVNATIWHPYNIRAWSETPFSVLATPLADLAVNPANIVRTGTLLEGNNQRFNITVRNTGIANATDARINISMDGTLLNSSVRTVNKNANVSISINWTATPGQHNISVSVDPQNLIEESNEANNLAWSLFTVAARTIGITLDLSVANVEPSTPLWANGTVIIDGAAAPAGTEVNVSIEGTDQYWLVNTDAAGNYSAPFNASAIEGNYAINATVQYPGFEIYAWAEESLTVAIPPTPDLAIFNSNITIIGNLVNGTALYFNIAVRNIGTAAANGAQVNISINGVLLSSQRQNFAVGQERILNVSWTAETGNHNVTVEVDKEGKFAELFESNNNAWKTFTVTAEPDDEPDSDGDGVPDSEDAFPNDPAASIDSDGDGYPDSWNPGMTEEDSTTDLVLDAFPNDPEKWESEEGGSPWLMIALAIIVIAIVAILVLKFVIMKPKL